MRHRELPTPFLRNVCALNQIVLNEFRQSVPAPASTNRLHRLVSIQFVAAVLVALVQFLHS